MNLIKQAYFSGVQSALSDFGLVKAAAETRAERSKRLNDIMNSVTGGNLDLSDIGAPSGKGSRSAGQRASDLEDMPAPRRASRSSGSSGGSKRPRPATTPKPAPAPAPAPAPYSGYAPENFSMVPPKDYSIAAPRLPTEDLTDRINDLDKQNRALKTKMHFSKMKYVPEGSAPSWTDYFNTDDFKY